MFGKNRQHQDTRTEYIPATQAYKEYSFPRSALRELADDGRIGMRVKKLFGGKVMKLYKRADIERYLNEQ